uniref:Myb-like domain-containing protein n=2 Tax=Schistocephalus solidus TaxID=70667 RepID=A0A0V0J444_SCHSO
MSNTELALLATTFSIIIHFAALWGHTLEKRWMLHERLETHYKRHKASDKRKIAIDAEIAEQLKEIASPTLWDILPIYLIRVFFNFIRSIPSFISFVIKFIKDLAEEKKRTKEEIKELERLEEERKLRKTLKKKQPGKLPKNRLDVDVSLMATFSPDNLKVSTDELSETDDRPINTKDWTPDEEAIFIRLTNKYPGGFPNRWRKIAEVLGRSVADVTARASAISARMSERMQLNPDFESDAANASDAEREDSDDYYLSKRKAKRLGKAPKIAVPKVETAEDDEDGDPASVEGCDDAVDSDDQYGYTSRNKQKKQSANKSAPQRKFEDSSVVNGGWSQKEQNQLETAIKSIPKGVPDRWQRIAECVPTKSLHEITARVKLLSEVSKQKQQPTNCTLPNPDA